MSGMTVFDSILIWDKIMTMEQRKELITNCWSVDKKIIEYDENFLPLMEQSGENMSDLDRKKLHQAMTLSPRAQSSPTVPAGTSSSSSLTIFNSTPISACPHEPNFPVGMSGM